MIKNVINTKELRNVEEELWKALDMDNFSDEIISDSFPTGQSARKGTGSTVNACNQCTNSATTAGCGTCRW